VDTGYLHVLRRFSRDVCLYLITAALIGFTIFGGIYTVLLNLYLVRLGYGPSFVGLVNAAGPLAMAIFCLPAGAFGGRWGSRRAMIAGLSLSIPGFGLLPLAEYIPPLAQAGWLLTTYISLFFIGAGLTAIGALLFWAYFRQPRGEFAHSSALDKATERGAI
jgi:MFS family permease